MKNITKQCLKKGLIIKYDTNQWAYTAELTSLIRKLEEDFIKNISALEFKEWTFPNIIKKRTLQQYGCTDVNPF